jgi:hypothetical protein
VSDDVEGRCSLAQACRKAGTLTSFEEDRGESRETVGSILTRDLIKKGETTAATLQEQNNAID